MSESEEKPQIEAHADLGDEASPPSGAEGIGDSVKHPGSPIAQRLETVLVNEESKRSLDDLIDQQVGRRNLLPTADPMHRNNPPVAAVQFDEPSLQCWSIGHQLDEFEGRRHHLGEIARIRVEGEKCLRRRIDDGAGGKHAGRWRRDFRRIGWVGCHVVWRKERLGVGRRYFSGTIEVPRSFY